MKVDLTKFSPAARNIVAMARLISEQRGRKRIDDDDLMLATAAVESPVLDALKGLDVNFPSLAKTVDFDPSAITQTPLTVELPIPELDIYQDFNPSGAFVVRWAPNLATNSGDEITDPRHLLFVALVNKTAAPSKMVEKAYHGSSHDPVGILREKLGFLPYNVTRTNEKK